MASTWFGEYDRILLMIREQRGRIGYSQTYVAAKIKVSQSCFGKMENGVLRISVGRFADICWLLEMPVIPIMTSEKLQGLLSAIRQRREQLNYSQEYVAYKLGITQKGYSKIERGDTKLFLDDFLQLCEILGITAEELLSDVAQTSVEG